MKKILLSLFFACFIYACSLEQVKSSENYIEKFEIEGMNNINISIKNNQSLIYIYLDALEYENLKGKLPKIIISDAATISANKDTTLWMDSNFKYTITAENNGTRDYFIEIDTVVQRMYDFNDWKIFNDKYYSYYMPASLQWSSGNEGIGLAFSMIGINAKDPENYPTRKTTEGYIGNAVIMETIEGGDVFGMQKPLFSGNFFLGNFNLANFGTGGELAAVELGTIYMKKPSSAKGFYKYTEGPEVFMNNGVQEAGRNDSCNMDISFYRSDLPNGKDTILTVKDIDSATDLVIARAKINSCVDTGDEFKEFELELVYTEEPDFVNHRYKLAMTFAASKNGDVFAGKIGSKLIIDELEIVNYEN